jgi:hypothetical protein
VKVPVVLPASLVARLLSYRAGVQESDDTASVSLMQSLCLSQHTPTDRKSSTCPRGDIVNSCQHLCNICGSDSDLTDHFVFLHMLQVGCAKTPRHVDLTELLEC